MARDATSHIAQRSKRSSSKTIPFVIHIVVRSLSLTTAHLFLLLLPMCGHDEYTQPVLRVHHLAALHRLDDLEHAARCGGVRQHDRSVVRHAEPALDGHFHWWESALAESSAGGDGCLGSTSTFVTLLGRLKCAGGGRGSSLTSIDISPHF